jgi:MYXO-CTERM domain-containing protein
LAATQRACKHPVAQYFDNCHRPIAAVLGSGAGAGVLVLFGLFGLALRRRRA